MHGTLGAWIAVRDRASNQATKMNEALPIVERISDRLGGLAAAADRHSGALRDLGINFREGLASLERAVLCAALRFAGLFVRREKA